MSGRPGAAIVRNCILCGEQYNPKSTRQKCCNKVITVPCVICGKPMQQICTTKAQPKTCSKECTTKLGDIGREQAAHKLHKICKYCGKEFTPNSSRDEYCSGPHYATCEVCGKQFLVTGRYNHINKTCSDACSYISAKRNTDMIAMTSHIKETMLSRYGVENSVQIPGVLEKTRQTSLHRYGVEYYTQTSEYKDRVRATDLQKYGVDHHLKSSIVKLKRLSTIQQKYNADNVFASDFGKAKIRSTMQEKYGVINPSQNAEIKRRATNSARKSSLEQRVSMLLTQYNIEFESHYHISVGELHHEFDFYIPKYKILVDADGLYYHSYLSDPDGKRVRDDYDEVRLVLVPKDHIFHLIIEGYEDSGVKQLVDIIKDVDAGAFDYETNLFQWCRSIEFPYPQYDIERRCKDYKSLCNYTRLDSYNPNSRIGESILLSAHKSIYSAHCGNKPSPIEGWYNDTILKKAILNRLIYINEVNPSKILRGLYISKLAPRVSIFNPVLAKYLTMKYLSEYAEIYDPFSGYSGRLLGVSATGKRYIGRDINAITVSEANTIIADMGLHNCSVEVANVLESSGCYDCLLTCPPYGSKEIYGFETIFKSCDEWIDECLSRFRCKKYVFVVDSTTKYATNVVEHISMASHLNDVSEYIVVI